MASRDLRDVMRVRPLSSKNTRFDGKGRDRTTEAEVKGGVTSADTSSSSKDTSNGLVSCVIGNHYA